MLRNSTQKFRQKYHSNTKITRTISFTRTQAFSSQSSLEIKSQTKLTMTKSTPKLQNTRSRISLTQPLIMSKQKNNKFDRQDTISSNQKNQAQYIQNLVRRKGVQQSQVQCLKLGKLKKMSKNKIITRKAQQFIDQMPANTIFFCCSCFHYVFQIQKKRHFPDCKDELNLKASDIHEIGIRRLQKITELAKYTGTKTNQIQELFKNFLHNNLKQLQSIQQPPISDFYTLEEIIFAFGFTYKKLLKHYKHEKGSFFDCY